jgi:hypothetical protein
VDHESASAVTAAGCCTWQQQSESIAVGHESSGIGQGESGPILGAAAMVRTIAAAI